MQKDSASPTESFFSSRGGGLYIHVPFCRGKCIYCDFYSVGDRIADRNKYVDALTAELHARKDELPQPLRTIYIGGGTPSLMTDEEFARLCHELHPLAGNVEEFTMEVNPDDVTPGKLREWKRGGVNRLSLGIQSFNDDTLKTIRRRHTATGAIRAYEAAKEVFQNISIDLIYGIPGQTIEIWRRDIETALTLRPTHISSYSLMYEPGTALSLLRDKGILKETSDDISEQMMLILNKELRNAGYDHYEISNFALQGYRSIHNTSYWHRIPYLGLGPSAHSYDGKRLRIANRADVRGYISVWRGEDNTPNGHNKPATNQILSDTEILTDEELKEECIMTSLRTREGIDISAFEKAFGRSETEKLIERSGRWIEENMLQLKEGFLSLTEEAILISDTIIVDLIM